MLPPPTYILILEKQMWMCLNGGPKGFVRNVLLYYRGGTTNVVELVKLSYPVQNLANTNCNNTAIITYYKRGRI